jgi:hypothetical protein
VRHRRITDIALNLFSTDTRLLLTFCGFSRNVAIQQQETNMKYEIVCIKRQGYSILHTEGLDFAAKVTYHAYEDGKRIVVKQELLIPRLGYWGE